MLNPGRVLTFLKKSKDGTFYPSDSMYGILPVTGSYLSWTEKEGFSKKQTMNLDFVLKDIRAIQNKARLAKQ